MVNQKLSGQFFKGEGVLRNSLGVPGETYRAESDCSRGQQGRKRNKRERDRSLSDSDVNSREKGAVR